MAISSFLTVITNAAFLKIITQMFLYKFLNDKFVHEVKLLDKKAAEAENWEDVFTLFKSSSV